MWPTPFGPRTTLSFAVPREGRVRLSIHDVEGRLVRTLVDERRPAGEHGVSWDGRNESGRPVASGVYLSRMEAGEVAVTQRIVRLR